jgi:hypothetical protein
VGRHSIPDPDDSAGEAQHDEPETTRFGHAGGSEPDPGAGVDEPESDAPQYRPPP